jgi:nicotinamidase-related amidase
MAVSLDNLLQQGRAAFVLCEVQDSVVGASAPWPQLVEAVQRIDLIGNAAKIANAMRRRGEPVIHCTAENLPGAFGANGNARLFANARKQGGLGKNPAGNRPSPAVWSDQDILLPRYHGLSPMTGTALDSLLRNEGKTTLILAGVSVSFAITNLTMDAVNRGYQVILPRDAVAGFPEDYAALVMKNTLSMLATIVTTEDVLAALG